MPFLTYEFDEAQTESDSASDSDRVHRAVRFRAYLLWEKAGRPMGMRDARESWQDYFWNQAKRQLLDKELFSDALTGGWS
jgi:hypothetical protein